MAIESLDIKVYKCTKCKVFSFLTLSHCVPQFEMTASNKVNSGLPPALYSIV